ncbi:hypothetical protein SDC9_176564 [bioreactor metagenome]|uniref:TATA-box binding protein n=1 Tax=bioreactor metagenome TaxID=1076179 RepID=A0A645GZQ8_9ZZZZ
MKVIKFITTFLLLFIIGIFTSYASVKYNNWTDNFINTFEQTEANFKFYNIKINCVVSNVNSKKQIESMCTDIVNSLNLNADKIKLREEHDNEIKIYAQIKDGSYNVSFTAIKKNSKEYYIIIDILSNKVYKNIGDIYRNLDDILHRRSNDVQIYLCMAGEYTKKLQLYKSNDILENILYNMNAKEIDRVREDNLISVTAYSKLLKENDLDYLENKINLNIGIRYSENEDKTLIYMATPIIKLDY